MRCINSLAQYHTSFKRYASLINQLSISSNVGTTADVCINSTRGELRRCRVCSSYLKLIVMKQFEKASAGEGPFPLLHFPTWAQSLLNLSRHFWFWMNLKHNIHVRLLQWSLVTLNCLSLCHLTQDLQLHIINSLKLPHTISAPMSCFGPSVVEDKMMLLACSLDNVVILPENSSSASLWSL